MAGPYGRLCRNLFAESLHIKGKLILDSSGNLTVANSTQENAHISGNLFTGGICEYEMGQGITLKGNVIVEDGYELCASSIKGNLDGDVNASGNICVADGFQVQTSKITEKVSGNGVIVDTYLPKRKFGLGRAWGNVVTTVDNGNTIQVPLFRKSFESTFTTTRNIVHPAGNTYVTFQAPSTANINCNYTTALVRVDVALAVTMNNGEANDNLVFTVRKNKTETLSKFTHSLMGPCVDADQTFAWSDVVVVAPNDTLDLYVLGTNISGNLDAEIRPGSTETFAAFEIESLE
jgi:cytoskeletal protein CcmA (bactofilin family)